MRKECDCIRPLNENFIDRHLFIFIFIFILGFQGFQQRGERNILGH